MSTFDPGLGPLVGSWRLISAQIVFSDNGERVDTFGPNPAGRMVFASTGRIMFLVMRGDRRQPANDSERASLFNTMISYTGRVRLAGSGQFITTLDVSLVPSETGAEFLRFFEIDGDRLTVRLPEQIGRFSQGRMMVSELTWEREQ
jgi:hypothetical protein